jgi:hypothetical protein
VPARFVGTLFYVPQKPRYEAALSNDPSWIFTKKRKSLADFVNVSCPRLPASATA